MKKISVFDATTFGHDEVPVQQSAAGWSTDVLIDLTGERKKFAFGWYDHKYCGWFLDNNIMVHNPKKMRWSFLPLAIYDTKPELRKTVKI